MKVLTSQEAMALVDALDVRDDAAGRRADLVIRLMLESGLRRCELTPMDLHQVNLAAGTILILGRGGRRPETARPTPGTSWALQRWLEVRGTAPGPLLIDLRNGARLAPAAITALVRRAGRDAGLDHLTPMALRTYWRSMGGEREAERIRRLAAHFRISPRQMGRYADQAATDRRRPPG